MISLRATFRTLIAGIMLASLSGGLCIAEPSPTDTARAISIKSDDQSVDLSQATWLLEDKEGSLTLEDVRSPAYGKAFRAGSPTIGFTSSAYWVRFTLRNESAGDLVRWLDTGNHQIGEVDFFAPDATGLYRHQSTGWMQPYGQRPILARNFVFPLTLKTGEAADYYLRIRTPSSLPSLRLSPILWEIDSFNKTQKSFLVQSVYYYGLITAIAVLNLFLFYTTYDRLYLYYVLSLLSLSVLQDVVPSGWGFLFFELWPNDPTLNQISMPLSIFLYFTAIIAFITRFLDLPRKSPNILILLQFYLPILILLFLIEAAPNLFDTTLFIKFGAIKPIAELQHASFIFPSFIIIYSIYKSVKEGQVGSKFLLYAFIPLLLIAPLRSALLAAGITKDFNFQPIMVASGWEMIMMSLALAARFNQERKDKETAQAALIEGLRQSERDLENKVVARTQELQQEKMRAKELLNNILPSDLADELAVSGTARPARHESVTVLFTDFSGFTQVASTMPADRMVAELNQIFAAFDDIADECGVEKIKTIGDSYMAAAGLPKPCADHAKRCVRAGLKMLNYVERRNRDAPFKWSLRVGIHSGPVVAGVVGKRKYAFDIWGDTVNVASRMESSGEAGQVNISAYTYDLIQDEFDCHYRGKVGAKGKGEIDMYFVERGPPDQAYAPDHEPQPSRASLE